MISYYLLWAILLLFTKSISGNDKEWDLLIFTQNWPPTVCEHYREESESHVCAKLENPDSWTIHGVWPTKLHTLGPGFCNTSMKFDPSKLTDIWEDLQVSWPGIEADKGMSSLWSHEWEKHGTCAVQLPSLDSEEKYFRKGLDWLHQYNMTDILARSGITPSDTVEYPVEVFQKAVISALSVNPRIECVIERHSKKPALLELRICFDKSLTLADCDGTMLNSYDKPILTNCPPGRNIQYKTRMPGAPPRARRGRSTIQVWRSVIEVLLFLDWVI